MFDLVELIYEFQLLRAKSESLGIPLTDDERAHLIGLARMLDSGGGADPIGRAFVRVGTRGPVQFTAPPGFGLGQLANLGGGGVAIATSRPLAPGSRTVLRLVDPTGNREFVFPCRVVWRRTGRDACMGVAFDGVPLRLAFGLPRGGEWRRTIRLGADVDDSPARA